MEVITKILTIISPFFLIKITFSLISIVAHQSFTQQSQNEPRQHQLEH